MRILACQASPSVIMLSLAMLEMPGWYGSVLLLFLAWSMLLFPSAGFASTIWSAAGTSTASGGTLVAKNGDWLLEPMPVLGLRKTKSGTKYYGLFAEYQGKLDLKAGINEHGLVVVSASAPYSGVQLREMPRTQHLNEKLLSRSNSVSKALKQRHLFVGPRFLILADKKKIALVEIGPENEIAIEVRRDGVLFHTNHYTAPGLLRFNPPRPELGHTLRRRSSVERHESVAAYMTAKDKYTMEDFISISQSRDRGADDSIWREGTANSSTVTRMTWILHHSPDAVPELYVKLVFPDRSTSEKRIVLNDAFWKQDAEGTP